MAMRLATLDNMKLFSKHAQLAAWHGKKAGIVEDLSRDEEDGWWLNITLPRTSKAKRADQQEK